MNLPLLIARRSASHLSPVQQTMKRIASIAITISIAVMIITVAVVGGFREQIDKATHFLTADIIVSATANRSTTSQPQPILQSDSLRNVIASTPGCEAIRPFAICAAIARNGDNAASVIIKGIDSNYPLATFEELIIEGRSPRRDTSHREVAIPHKLTQTLGLKTGDRIELLLMGKDARPERTIFKISGTYNAIGGSLGVPMLLTRIHAVQRINGWSEQQISGFEIETTSRAIAEEVADLVEMRLMYDYEGNESLQVSTIAHQFQSIYAWLETHDINAIVVIVIMFAVALFNVITTLLTMVAERTKMVGILKSLGMTNRTLRCIFLYRTAEIVALGVVAGNIIGGGLAALQALTHIVPLNSEAYIIDHVPIAINIGDILLIDAIFVVAIIAFTSIATSIIQRITPAVAVKYE